MILILIFFIEENRNNSEIRNPYSIIYQLAYSLNLILDNLPQPPSQFLISNLFLSEGICGH